jgi:AcrR family transcriptional regulator
MATARLNSQARRAMILDRAVELFAEKGFRGVTTREIAAAVGVSEPVLYQHFTTKSDLYRAIIEKKAVYDNKPIPDEFTGAFDHTKDDRVFLIELANGIINWHTRDVGWIRLLMFSALEHHELSEMFFERYSKAFFTELAGYFRRRIEAGAFRDADPILAAHTFVGLACHYGVNLALFHRGMLDLPQHQIVEGFVDFFLEGIRKRS